MNLLVLANHCGRNVDDFKDVLEQIAPKALICRKIGVTGSIIPPAPKHTFVIIAVGRLHEGNGMFRIEKTKEAPDLGCGQAIIISGKKDQHFQVGNEEIGIGIFLRFDYESEGVTLV